MLEPLLIGILLVAATVAIHAFGTTHWTRYLRYHFATPHGHLKPHKALPAVTWTAVVLLLLHVVEVGASALAYLLLLPGNQLTSFEEAAYFSVVTFTTLGYGDITLVEHDWRLLSGLEALNGILLVGWTTALLYVVVQRSWGNTGQDHAE